MAVRNGCDLNCGKTFPNLVKAIELGLITEKEIDTAVKRLFIARFRLGMFDPEDRVPYAKISADKVHCPAHRQLARQAARQSIVLLKNAGNLLPLDRNKIKSIAVIGPNAMNQKALLANYYGLSTNLITVVQGIVGAVSPGTQVTYDRGCELAGKGAVQTTSIGWTLENTDLILAVLGNSPEIEGEEAEEAASDGGGDRQNISLPGRQEELLRYLHNTGKPVVLVLMGGGAIEINWAQENIPAILTAWYPGEEGGSAIADVLFGDYNPAGRLPVTFYKSLAQLPEFTDYNMKGRTYRYMTEEPLYPFGYGLSYTTFTYKNLRLNKEQINIGQGITASVDVTNTGRCSGNEIVQLYTNCRNVAPEGPLCQLRGFQRISLKPQETKTITFELAANQLAIVDNNGQSVIKPGNIEIIVAGHSPISCPHLYGDENLLKKNLKIR
jgi:beta-glucosidase